MTSAPPMPSRPRTRRPWCRGSLCNCRRLQRSGPLVGQPSVDPTIAAQQAFLVDAEQEVAEDEAEQMRRVAWIKHYIKMGEYDKAIELGWDGDMEFAQALLAEAEAGEQEGGAPLRGPLVSAGGAEGGTGRANSKQLCRI